ncbi:hypothetical protein VNO78_13137 [Psophocarpus tetragonolobus]|uniref:Uncharacterized protein n=1 Tax=Psophocarpus tetragonolobus TaxID=3891 RepID=A0AAN9SNU8_PSOTE
MISKGGHGCVVGQQDHSRKMRNVHFLKEQPKGVGGSFQVQWELRTLQSSSIIVPKLMIFRFPKHRISHKVSEKSAFC